MIKTYLFFDQRLIGLTRFASTVAKHLKDSEPNARFVFCYLIKDVPEPKARASFPPGTNLHKLSLFKPSNIFNKYSPTKLITFAQRISDTLLVNIAKKHGCDTYMIQHGMYIPFMKRETKALIGRIDFIAKSLILTKHTAAITEQPILRLLKLYYHHFIKGANNGRLFNTYGLNCDKVLIYGEYWRDYHSNQFGYSKGQQTIIGTPDLDNTAPSSKGPKSEDSENKRITYVAQTLLEDGRAPRATIETFLKRLYTISLKHEFELNIKLHPRSDLSLYTPLEHAVLHKSEVPSPPGIGVGHYSSLLVQLAYLTPEVFLFELDGHPIPECIQPLGRTISLDAFDNYLASRAKKRPTTGIPNAEIEHYFKKAETNSLEEAASIIKKPLSRECLQDC